MKKIYESLRHRCIFQWPLTMLTPWLQGLALHHRPPLHGGEPRRPGTARRSPRAADGAAGREEVRPQGPGWTWMELDEDL